MFKINTSKIKKQDLGPVKIICTLLSAGVNKSHKANQEDLSNLRSKQQGGVLLRTTDGQKSKYNQFSIVY